MTQRKDYILSVSVALRTKKSLEMAIDYCGMKASSYVHQALIEKLCREGHMESPMQIRAREAAALEAAAGS
jgi:hypothetical protein